MKINIFTTHIAYVVHSLVGHSNYRPMYVQFKVNQSLDYYYYYYY